MSIWKRSFICILCLTITLESTMVMAEATSKSLSMEQVQGMALATDDAFTRKNNEIILETMKYEDTVRSVQEKQRNMRSFRWTPLLKFKFPEKPNLSESMEFMFKPLVVQANITKLNHEMGDLKYKILGDVTQTYTNCFIFQEKISSNEMILVESKEDLNQASFLSKTKPEYEVEKVRLEKKIEILTSKISQEKRSLETEKKTLSDQISLDVTTGHTFENELEQLDITRDKLPEIVRHTLDNSQELFEAKVTRQTAELNFNTAEQMMRSFYGNGYMAMIDPYLTQVRQGADVDTAGFQLRFKAFLKAVDSRWQGKRRIIFFKFPKDWFKGSLSGIRYVEDEPFFLMTASLEYQGTVKEEQSLEKDIRTQVESEFENIITAHNAYKASKVSIADTKEELAILTELNKLGKADGDEVSDKQDDYQELQMDTLDMLSDYNALLIAYDRLTCGGITKYLTGEGFEQDAGNAGDMLAVVSPIDEPYYYIESRVEDRMFVLGVGIPDEFLPTITDFELWYDGIQVGKRTEITKQIKHLTIAAANEENMIELRFYADGKPVQNCEVDSTQARAPLPLQPYTEDVTEDERSVGTFEIEADTELGVVRLKIKPTSGEGIASWRIVKLGAGPLFSEAQMDAEETLTYLKILGENLADVQIELYNRSGALLHTGRMDVDTMQIMVGAQEE